MHFNGEFTAQRSGERGRLLVVDLPNWIRNFEVHYIGRIVTRRGYFEGMWDSMGTKVGKRRWASGIPDQTQARRPLPLGVSTPHLRTVASLISDSTCARLG